MPEELISKDEEGVLAMIASRFESEEWKKIEAFEQEAAKYPQPKLPLNHIFTKNPGEQGLYTREIFMPAGTIVTSRIHLKQTPFVISKGRVSVYDGGKWVHLSAPFTGVTEPGARRLLVVHEDTIWSAFFVTDETDPDKIGMDVTFTGGKFKELGLAAKDYQHEPALA